MCNQTISREMVITSYSKGYFWAPGIDQEVDTAADALLAIASGCESPREVALAVLMTLDPTDRVGFTARHKREARRLLGGAVCEGCMMSADYPRPPVKFTTSDLCDDCKCLPC